jgi:hypothetical protein
MSIGRVAALALVVVALGVTGVTGAGTSAKKQHVTIDQEERPDLHKGTWEMLVWTPGVIKDDGGSYTWSVSNRKRGTKDGQEFERVISIVTFTGKNGAFKVREDDTLVSSGRGRVATGTWRMLSGTEAYEGVKGGGRLAAALGLVKPDPWRYEGFLKAP